MSIASEVARLLHPPHEPEPREKVSWIGAPLPRLNDERLLRGGGCYVADLIARSSALHVAVVRSAHAHANIAEVNVEAALAMPGVGATLTVADLKDVRDIPIDWTPPGMVFRPEHPVLARGSVRYRGQPIAAVAARTPEQARAAADGVIVRYEARPAVLDQERALEAEAPLVHPRAPSA